MNIRASGISFMFFLFSDHPPYGSIDWTGSNWPPNGDIVMLFLDTRYVICSTPCMDYPWLWNNSFQLCICFFLDRSQAGYSADPSYETILSNLHYFIWTGHKQAILPTPPMRLSCPTARTEPNILHRESSAFVCFLPTETYQVLLSELDIYTIRHSQSIHPYLLNVFICSFNANQCFST